MQLLFHQCNEIASSGLKAGSYLTIIEGDLASMLQDLWMFAQTYKNFARKYRGFAVQEDQSEENHQRSLDKIFSVIGFAYVVRYDDPKIGLLTRAEFDKSWTESQKLQSIQTLAKVLVEVKKYGAKTAGLYRQLEENKASTAELRRRIEKAQAMMAEREKDSQVADLSRQLVACRDYIATLWRQVERAQARMAELEEDDQVSSQTSGI
ncbi:MAG: hypothetical protein M1820_000626 [Bogoriella megaspora]|nr:MAG: hypothetical protein M1820_000626 [Bogoriella megaspora]